MLQLIRDFRLYSLSTIRPGTCSSPSLEVCPGSAGTGGWAGGRAPGFSRSHGHVVSVAMSFQGNSNNIATVDISAGFVGLNTYVEVPAMFLTAFATYAGPVLWASHLVNFLSWEPNRCSSFSVPHSLSTPLKCAAPFARVMGGVILECDCGSPCSCG